MVIGQCEACGLVQIIQPVPSAEIQSRFDWIIYNEPEGHLELLVEELAHLPEIRSDSSIGAIVFGGDTTISRFQKRGFHRTWRIDPERDLGISDRAAGVETIQEKLTSETARTISHREGKFDLLVVRHMLEHTHDLRRFLNGIIELLRPGAYVVFEVPDCVKAFALCDYSILWEEHLSYFTPETFQFALESYGFEMLHLQQPQYSLVAITRFHGPAVGTTQTDLSQEKERLEHFTEAFPERRRLISEFLERTRTREGKVAMFGAGHLACVYINLLRLTEQIDCVIDDHPKKRGLFMPGSRLPIFGSEALVERDIKLCLSTLSPETEKKVIEKNSQFAARGGRLLSIFPERANSLLL